MAREVVDVTLDEYGHERHPAFGLIGASRVSLSNPGSVLFDSDIRHSNSVIVRVKAASRKRDLHHDYKGGREDFIEVEMSEAQWASFVSSMNSGDGVPCTIRRHGRETVPGLPYDPRLAHSLNETRDAAQQAFGDVVKALADYEDALTRKAPAAERREALQTLRARVHNAVPNVTYASETLAGHAEEVVTRARADIEAFVTMKARQLGIDPATINDAPMLGSGEPNLVEGTEA